MTWRWCLAALCSCASPALPRVEGLRPLPPPTAGRAEVVLRCTPPDAEVSLDGVGQGTCDDFDGTPGGLALGARARRVEVKKRGYAPWESWLDASGTRITLDVTLVPQEGSSP